MLMKGMEDITGVAIMTGIEAMTGMGIVTGINGMKNDVRQEMRASLQRRLKEVKSGMDEGGY